MFRSLLIALVATTYLLFSSGVVVNVHYCMNAIASVSFGYEGDHSDGSCSKCGMDKGMYACCKDEVQEVKLEDAHQPAVFAMCMHPISELALLNPDNLLTALQGCSAEPYAFADLPPPRAYNKLYRSLNVFRI